MRAFQIFASLSNEQAVLFFEGVRKESPGMYAQILQAASATLRSRPAYLKKQPADKRAAAMRRSLSRVNADSLAEEILAVYFLEGRPEVLSEWLDTIGVRHEDGILQEDTPAQPEEGKLKDAVTRFRSAGDEWDRELLLQAFSSQSAVEWPALEALLETQQAVA